MTKIGVGGLRGPRQLVDIDPVVKRRNALDRQKLGQRALNVFRNPQKMTAQAFQKPNITALADQRTIPLEVFIERAVNMPNGRDTLLRGRQAGMQQMTGIDMYQVRRLLGDKRQQNLLPVIRIGQKTQLRSFRMAQTTRIGNDAIHNPLRVQIVRHLAGLRHHGNRLDAQFLQRDDQRTGGLIDAVFQITMMKKV